MQRYICYVLRRLNIGNIYEKGKVRLSGLSQHKFTYVAGSNFCCGAEIHLVVYIRIDCICIYLRKGRCHCKERQEQGEADNSNVGRNSLGGQRPSYETENDNYPRKGGHHHHKARKYRKAREYDYEFNRSRPVLSFCLSGSRLIDKCH